jgi:hypothetical protein
MAKIEISIAVGAFLADAVEDVIEHKRPCVHREHQRQQPSFGRCPWHKMCPCYRCSRPAEPMWPRHRRSDWMSGLSAKHPIIRSSKSGSSSSRFFRDMELAGG